MRFRTDRSGAAAVEFAVLSPLYLMILMGMVAYGIHFGASHSIQQITADVARHAVAGLNPAERQLIVERYVDEHAEGYAFVHRDRVGVSVSESGSTQFTVTISYDTSELPIWGLFRSLPMPAQTITHKSVVRIGGV